MASKSSHINKTDHQIPSHMQITKHCSDARTPTLVISNSVKLEIKHCVNLYNIGEVVMLKTHASIQGSK